MARPSNWIQKLHQSSSGTGWPPTSTTMKPCCSFSIWWTTISWSRKAQRSYLTKSKLTSRSTFPCWHQSLLWKSQTSTTAWLMKSSWKSNCQPRSKFKPTIRPTISITKLIILRPTLKLECCITYLWFEQTIHSTSIKQLFISTVEVFAAKIPALTKTIPESGPYNLAYQCLALITD